MRNLADVPEPDPHVSVNALLRLLPPATRAVMLATCERRSFNCGDRLTQGQVPLIFFPETAILSIVNSHGTEIGLVGYEGMTGWSILLGSLPQGVTSVVECSGDVLTLPVTELTRLCRILPPVQAMVLRFVEVAVAQMADAIGAASHHGVAKRLARRLLMLHDRGIGDSYDVTHARLAEALSVRRASVTDRLHILEGEHTLRCTRSRITILDRSTLVAKAGAAYGGAEQAYRQTIGAFGKA